MAKRRANGEGSIYRRKDGTWTAQYTDANRKKRYLYGKTQQAVKDKLKEAIRDTDKGLWADGGKVTFCKWVNDWLEVYKKPVVRPKTYALYYDMLKSHIEPHFQKVRLKDIRPDMIQKFLSEKATGGRRDGQPGGYSYFILNQLRSVIKLSLEQAVDNNMIISNPAKAVKIPKAPYKEKEILSREDQKKLEETILNDYNLNAFMFFLGLYTGLRIGELLALRIEDIDFDRKEMRVRRSIARAPIPGENRSEKFVNGPKTVNGIRTIPLPDFLLELLKQHIERRNEFVDSPAMHVPEGWADKGYLFITYRGTVPEYYNMHKILDRLFKQAGVKRVSPHALRHTFATRAIEAGFDVKSLSEILGHADAKTTLNIYAHTLEAQKRENMNRLNGVYTSASYTKEADN